MKVKSCGKRHVWCRECLHETQAAKERAGAPPLVAPRPVKPPPPPLPPISPDETNLKEGVVTFVFGTERGYGLDPDYWIEVDGEEHYCQRRVYDTARLGDRVRVKMKACGGVTHIVEVLSPVLPS